MSINIIELLRDEICECCVHERYIRGNCHDNCPFEDEFAELETKCNKIEEYADKLADLVGDEDSVEHIDDRNEEEKSPWSHWAMKDFF